MAWYETHPDTIGTKLDTLVVGVAGAYKLARGESTLDGANPTPVAHGLTSCVAFVPTLKGTTAPGVGTSLLTANINGANVDVYAWKVTSTGNTTLLASTGAESLLVGSRHVGGRSTHDAATLGAGTPA